MWRYFVMPIKIHRRLKKNSGFSLIEVMIAVFVFATGILGIAGLQLKGLNMLSNSNSVSVAMLGINDLADRMRANPTGITDGAYDSLDQDVTNPNCGTSCTSSELAQLDVFSVYSQLDTGLPSATLSVSNVGNDIFTIEVTWLERVGENSETKTHRVSFLPYKP